MRKYREGWMRHTAARITDGLMWFSNFLDILTNQSAFT